MAKIVVVAFALIFATFSSAKVDASCTKHFDSALCRVPLPTREVSSIEGLKVAEVLCCCKKHSGGECCTRVRTTFQRKPIGHSSGGTIASLNFKAPPRIFRHSLAGTAVAPQIKYRVNAYSERSMHDILKLLNDRSAADLGEFNDDELQRFETLCENWRTLAGRERARRQTLPRPTAGTA